MKILWCLIGCCLAISSQQVYAELGSAQHKLFAQPIMYAKQRQKQPLKINNAQQAAKRVTSKHGGKVLKVQRRKVNGSPGYKVKLLKNNGQIVSKKVNAKSGKVTGN